jgi:hypothetical protein
MFLFIFTVVLVFIAVTFGGHLMNLNQEFFTSVGVNLAQQLISPSLSDFSFSSVSEELNRPTPKHRYLALAN